MCRMDTESNPVYYAHHHFVLRQAIPMRSISTARTGVMLVVASLLAASIVGMAQFGAAGQSSQLVLVDKEGHRTAIGPLPLATLAPRISPDGRDVVFDTQDDGHVWIA